MKFYLRTSNGSTTTCGGGWDSLSKAMKSKLFRELTPRHNFSFDIVGIEDGVIKQTLTFS